MEDSSSSGEQGGHGNFEKAIVLDFLLSRMTLKAKLGVRVALRHLGGVKTQKVRL